MLVVAGEVCLLNQEKVFDSDNNNYNFNDYLVHPLNYPKYGMVGEATSTLLA